jgi:hypothetical protein
MSHRATERDSNSIFGDVSKVRNKLLNVLYSRQVYASYKEILQGQILWEGVTATFLQDAVTGRYYWSAFTGTQINTLITALQLHT